MAPYTRRTIVDALLTHTYLENMPTNSDRAKRCAKRANRSTTVPYRPRKAPDKPNWVAMISVIVIPVFILYAYGTFVRTTRERLGNAEMSSQWILFEFSWEFFVSSVHVTNLIVTIALWTIQPRLVSTVQCVHKETINHLVLVGLTCAAFPAISEDSSMWPWIGRAFWAVAMWCSYQPSARHVPFWCRVFWTLLWTDLGLVYNPEALLPHFLPGLSVVLHLIMRSKTHSKWLIVLVIGTYLACMISWYTGPVLSCVVDVIATMVSWCTWLAQCVLSLSPDILRYAVTAVLLIMVCVCACVLAPVLSMLACALQAFMCVVTLAVGLCKPTSNVGTGILLTVMVVIGGIVYCAYTPKCVGVWTEVCDHESTPHLSPVTLMTTHVPILAIMRWQMRVS